MGELKDLKKRFHLSAEEVENSTCCLLYLLFGLLMCYSSYIMLVSIINLFGILSIETFKKLRLHQRERVGDLSAGELN